MKADRILERCRAYAAESRAMRERIRRKREMATQLTRAIGDGPRGGGDGDRLSLLCGQVDELERERSVRGAAYELELMAADRALDAIGGDAAQAAYYYYVRGMRPSEIAREMHRSVRSVQQLRVDAQTAASMMDIGMAEWYIKKYGAK